MARSRNTAQAGFDPCVAHFISPLINRPLPEAVANDLRAADPSLAGRIAAGFSPEGFHFTNPDAPQFGVIVPDATWGPNAKLRVCFLNGTGSIWRKVEKYASLWAEEADLSFEFGAPREQSHIRITFEMPGFFSRLGREAEQFPRETMSLGFRNGDPETEIRRLVLHEFGHALGFMHEHQHPQSGIDWDERGAVDVYRPLLPRGLTDRQILEQLRAIPRNSFRYKVFPFDPKSIMMYSIPRQAVRAGSYKEEFGNYNTTLSKDDKKIVKIAYGGDGDGGGDETEIQVDGPPVANAITSDGEVDNFFIKVTRAGRYNVLVKGDALVHVDLTDQSGAPSFPGDRGGDSDSPRLGLKMLRFLEAGTWKVTVTASRFATFSRGSYMISVESATSP